MWLCGNFHSKPEMPFYKGLNFPFLTVLSVNQGNKFDNPRHTKKHAHNLKKKQQSLARKQKGSNTRKKARKLVALTHSKIRRVREDFLHKLSRKIVNENQVIAVENLNVKGMVRNHNLAKAISDCGWGQICTMLKYKSEWDGKTYIEVDRFFASSKTCSVCLNKVDSLPLDIRAWACSKCLTSHDRDVNAAVNIRNVREALPKASLADIGLRN
jgi:putative transposase